MPEMDGYEVCMQLKLDKVTRDIPVIFLTGQTHVEEETRGFDVDAGDYIHKPFSPAVVKTRVETHVVLRGIREQLAQQLLTIQKEFETARQINFRFFHPRSQRSKIWTLLHATFPTESLITSASAI
ncbi:MAG: Serine phosphatase RsbU, regulator of sigma subunit [Edaphobacter sp.]|nr:Serine phosphatase RsbU, regulator of sigma subunit [Edaphobacter sp.]